MAICTIAPYLTFADRSGWEADSEYARQGHFVNRAVRSHVIIHHTVTIDGDPTPNRWESTDEAFALMRRLQTIRPELGLDVPYNFVVFLMNTEPASMLICEGRGEDRTGAHTKGHNTTGIGISFAGNFHDYNVDFSRYTHLLSLFLGWLRFDPNHPDYGGPHLPMMNLGTVRPSGRVVFAHQDFKPTACPGRFLVPFLRQVDFVDPRV